MVLRLLIRQEKPRRLCFRGVSAWEAALVVVGGGRRRLALQIVFAPGARRRHRLLAAILIVNIALIVGAALGFILILPIGRSQITHKKVIASRIIKAEMRLLLVRRRRRRISMCGWFYIARRIIPLARFLVVPLRLRQRRLWRIRIGSPAEVGKAATLWLTVPAPLVLIGVGCNAFAR